MAPVQNIEEVKELEKKFGRSFYCVDIKQFSSNISKLRSSFEKYYKNVEFGYSYKTNYIPSICKEAKRHGVYAEVVSRLEYDLALKLGYEGRDIIFNGPVKQAKDLVDAINKGSVVNLDHFSEIQYLEDAKLAGEFNSANARIGLRINVGLIDESGRSVVQNGLAVGRFGFADSDLKEAVRRLRRIGIEPVSIHGHTSTSDRMPNNFSAICKRLCEIRNTHELNSIKYINVGGGIFGDMPADMVSRVLPSFSDYAEAVANALLADDWVKENKPTLVVEPGISVVANAVEFYTAVYSVKNNGSKKFVVVDGSIYNVKPTMHGLDLPVCRLGTNTNGIGDTYDIVGSTCMEKDILRKAVTLDAVNAGDYLVFSHVGAYTLVMTPPFINLAPAILVKGADGEVHLSRSAQKFEDFFINFHDICASQ